MTITLDEVMAIPLKPLTEQPLHAQELPDAHVWGCQANQDYPTVLLHFDWRCRACTEVAARKDGDRLMEWDPSAGANPHAVIEIIPLSWLVDRAFKQQSQSFK